MVDRNVILQGDVIERLRELPDGCVQTVVTSPPYWGLRDYGVAGQIGLEATPAEYVTRMVAVFREVKRVLRDDGTLWLNLGDSYCSDSVQRKRGANDVLDAREGRATLPKWSEYAASGNARYSSRLAGEGLKQKDLIGIPWRVAFALQDDGWWLRSDIVWAKPNPMPESVTDRPTRAHEYIFLLSKSAHYYYDADAIREPAKDRLVADFRNESAYVNQGTAPSNHSRTDKQRGHSRRHDGFNARWDAMSRDEQQALGANKRTVWTVATEPFPGAHFATFPQRLIEPCVLAGSSPQACEHCGAPWKRIVEAVGGTIGKSWHDHADDLGKGQRVTDKAGKGVRAGTIRDDQGRLYQRIERGWQPTCKCEGNTGAGRGLVLDPFMGSGTVALVATQWQRDYLGVELNPAYIAMAERRLERVQVKLFAS